MTQVVDRNIAKKVVVRKKEYFFDRKLLWFTGLIVVVTSMIYIWPPSRPLSIANYGKKVLVVTEESSEDNFNLALGHDLYSRGLYSEAVSYYSKYLETSNKGSKGATLAYNAGDICKDKLKDYEKAAKFYLQVKYFDSNSPLLQKTGLRIVACLEALGKNRQAQSQLDQMTNVDRKNSSKNPLSPIVAQTGTQDFTVADIEDGIAALPEDQRKLFEGKNGKIMFLQQQLLLPYLCYELGKKEGLDESKTVVTKLSEIRKSLVVQEVLNQKLSKIEMPTDEELQLFYKGNQKRYNSDFQKNKNIILQDYVNFEKNQKIQKLMVKQMKLQNVRLYTNALVEENREPMKSLSNIPIATQPLLITGEGK